MNIGKWQFLWWPRMTLFFYRPRIQDESGLYRTIYRFIVYVWPIEVRLFR